MNEEFSTNIYESKFELFNKQFWKQRENLTLSNFAKKKLEAYINGTSNLNEVFDLDKWAWFFSVVDLTYTYHGIDPRNVKFFYNPLSGLFEPIPYDGHRFARNYSEKLINFDHRNAFEISSFCLKNKCENDDIEKWMYSFFFNKDGSLNNEFYSKYMYSLQKITKREFP